MEQRSDSVCVDNEALTLTMSVLTLALYLVRPAVTVGASMREVMTHDCTM